MQHYIVFLRGINVSGKNILKMDALKKALHENNFPNALTYIQSGNIVIPNSNLSADALKKSIEKLLLDLFSIETITFIYTSDRIKKTIDLYPFSMEDTKKNYFVFLENEPQDQLISELSKNDYNEDTFSTQGSCIYVHCKNGYGKTKLHNNFFENKLKIKATTRNWNTMQKMLNLVEKC